MKDAGLVQFCTSSHVRGLTWDNAIVVVDEVQNMTWTEIDSIVTRVGQNTRLIMCGDSKHQMDLTGREKTGFAEMLCIIQRMNTFSEISFTHHDIVRSDFVKQWIVTRDELNL
jgi:phosphate starvation-inducible PhoH-like protein